VRLSWRFRSIERRSRVRFRPVPPTRTSLSASCSGPLALPAAAVCGSAGRATYGASWVAGSSPWRARSIMSPPTSRTRWAALTVERRNGPKPKQAPTAIPRNRPATNTRTLGRGSGAGRQGETSVSRRRLPIRLTLKRSIYTSPLRRYLCDELRAPRTPLVSRSAGGCLASSTSMGPNGLRSRASTAHPRRHDDRRADDRRLPPTDTSDRGTLPRSSAGLSGSPFQLGRSRRAPR
jgi:hypothetical protein